MLLLSVFIILLNVNPAIDNSFLHGEWDGKERIRIKVSSLGIDNWFDVDFKARFGKDGTFNLTTGNSFYDTALDGYKEDNGLAYDKYKLIPTKEPNVFDLKLFDEDSKDASIHRLEKLRDDEVVLKLVLSNGKKKDVILRK